MARSDWPARVRPEVRIGWEPHAGTRAHAHAHLVFPGHRHMRALINGVYKFSTRFQWCGRHNLINVGDEIELIAQRVFGSLPSIHVNKMNWGIYKKLPSKIETPNLINVPKYILIMK